MTNELGPMLHRDAVVALVGLCSQFVVSAAHKNDPKQVEAMMNTLLHKVEHCNTTTDCPKVGRISPISFGGFWWVDEDGKVSL